MKYKLAKIITTACLILISIAAILGVLTLFTERSSTTAPTTEKTDLTAIAEKEVLTEQDYATLWEQTGLGKTILQSLWKETNRKEILSAEQDRFFDAPTYSCISLALFSRAEIITNREDYYPIYDLQPGDVLLTKSTHTLCYRHGHSALYIGDGLLLEAAAIGLPTDTAKAELWGQYPSGIHLRLKESVAKEQGISNKTLGAQAADYAKEELAGDKYHLFSGAFGIGAETNHTQCAHLIYAAYQSCGIEVSAKDFPVTPHSLLESGQFEILHYWGFDPKDINW
ncbi:MAG: hypothetical protein IJC82_06130 [Firmicutes bacterium]|nr:hypothetical protein [Bacillota bacterium]